MMVRCVMGGRAAPGEFARACRAVQAPQACGQASVNDQVAEGQACVVREWVCGRRSLAMVGGGVQADPHTGVIGRCYGVGDPLIIWPFSWAPSFLPLGYPRAKGGTDGRYTCFALRLSC